MKAHKNLVGMLFWGSVGLFIVLYFVFFVTGFEIPIIRFLLTSLCYIYLLEGIFFAFTGNLLMEKESLQQGLGNKGHILVLTGISLVTYVPAYCTRWFFHDDWLHFSGHEQNFFEYSIMQANPLMGLLKDLFSSITVKNSGWLGLFVVVCVTIYGLMWNRIMIKTTKNSLLSILTASLMMLITPIVNIISYRGMFCYPLAFIYSMVSIICLKEGMKQEGFKRKVKYYIIGIGGIVLANFIDRTSSAVAIPVILAYYLFDKDREECKLFPICSIGYYVLGLGAYHLSAKVLAVSVDMEILNQQRVILSTDNVVERVKWFIEILNQGMNQIVSMIRTSMFQESFLVEYIHYKNVTKSKILLVIALTILIVWIYRRKPNNVLLGVIQLIILMALAYDKNLIDGEIIALLFWVILIVGVYDIKKNRGILGILQTVFLLVASYGACLLFVGSQYTSYYAVSMSSTILLLILAGCECLLERIKENLYIIGWGGLVLVIIMNQNSYLQELVEYRYNKYAVIKENLRQNYNGENRIHIIGELQPGEADIYMVAAVRMAFFELGIDSGDVDISTSSTESQIKNIAHYDELLMNAEKNDVLFLESIYISGDGTMGILRKELTESENNRLGEILKKADLIPAETEHTLLIDIRKS